MLTLVRSAFGALFLALVSAVFAISFAAIIYKGDLAPFLNRGIGLTLLGGIVIAATGAFTLSYRGTILAPQDVPAILLAGAAATLISSHELSGETLFATVACLALLSTLATGIAAFLVGHHKLAYVARYFPYPVLAGFLAATGLLLCMGGVSVALGATAQSGGWHAYLTPDATFKWAPALVAAALMVATTRLIRGTLVLPLALISTVLGYYLLLWLTGISFDQAQADGHLLGPFDSGGFLAEISPDIVLHADWRAIFSQAPIILTIVATCLIGTTLNASGLELEFRTDFDISKEVKGTGIANMLSACVGALPGYHIVAESILAKRLGLVGRLAGISSAIGCAMILLFGAGLLSVLPVGLFATVLVFLGMDLLFTWIWVERRRLDLLDYAIVLLIPVIAVSFSFLTAVAVGLLVACAFFIISYAKLEFIRSRGDLSARRSYVERAEHELEILAETGDQVKVIELSGFLFFGSSNALREMIQVELDASTPRVLCLIPRFQTCHRD